MASGGVCLSLGDLPCKDFRESVRGLPLAAAGSGLGYWRLFPFSGSFLCLLEASTCLYRALIAAEEASLSGGTDLPEGLSRSAGAPFLYRI